MSIAQAAAAAIQVFPNTSIVTRSGPYALPVVMVALAGPQSNWEPSVAGDPLGSCPGCTGPACQGYTSWGLWQIHNSTQPYLAQQTGSSSPCAWATWLADPVHNAQAAYYLYQLQGLQGAWGGTTTWDTDAVEAALPQAQAAVTAARTAAESAPASTPLPAATGGLPALGPAGWGLTWGIMFVAGGGGLVWAAESGHLDRWLGRLGKIPLRRRSGVSS